MASPRGPVSKRFCTRRYRVSRLAVRGVGFMQTKSESRQFFRVARSGRDRSLNGCLPASGACDRSPAMHYIPNWYLVWELCKERVATNVCNDMGAVHSMVCS